MDYDEDYDKLIAISLMAFDLYSLFLLVTSINYVNLTLVHARLNTSIGSQDIQSISNDCLIICMDGRRYRSVSPLPLTASWPCLFVAVSVCHVCWVSLTVCPSCFFTPCADTLPGRWSVRCECWLSGSKMHSGALMNLICKYRMLGCWIPGCSYKTSW